MGTTMSVLSPYSLWNLFVVLLQVALWSAVLVLIYRFLKTRNHLNTSCPVIPGLKEPVCSPYWIFRFLPSRETRKRMALPKSAYIAHYITGLAAIYPNEKIVRHSFPFNNFFSLTKPESVEEFLNSKVPKVKPFRNILTAWFGNGLFTSTGSKWKARKKLLSPQFHKDILKEFVTKFDKHSKILVDILKSRHHEKWINIVDCIALCSTDIICDTMLGVNIGAQKTENSELVNAMIRCSEALTERVINPIKRVGIFFSISATGRQFKNDTCYLYSFALEVIKQNKAALELQQNKTKTKEKDLVSLLVDVHMNNPEFSVKDIQEEIVSFIFGGQDTTAAAITWTLYLIGLYPEIQSKIHEELDMIFGDDHEIPVTADDLKEMRYLECVLKESLRLYPSVPINIKQVLEDCHICGCEIKKDSVIFFQPYQIHRDAEAFPNPEKFDPERFLPENCAARSPFAYIPFSSGTRTCMGRHFAMMEQKTVVGNVLRNFSLKSMEHRDEIFVSVEIILRSVHPVKIKFVPRETRVNSNKDPLQTANSCAMHT